MTPLQQHNNAVWNALQEGKVGAVIALFDEGYIELNEIKPNSRRQQLFAILTLGECGIEMEESEANYWLDWYGVK